MLFEILLFLLSVLFLAYMYLTWNNDYWLKQGIPYVEPEFIFGNIRDVFLMKKTIGEVYQQIYKKLGGKPLGGFFKLREPMLMVIDPSLIKDVLVDKFDCFHDNDIITRNDTEKILKMNPFLASGANWKPLRNVLDEALKGEKVKPMVSLLLPSCKRMIKFISNNKENPIDVQELSAKFATEVVASCSFGKETNSFANDCQFRPITKKLFNAGFKTNMAIIFAFYAPYLGSFFKYRIVGKRLTKFFTNIVSEVCKTRVKKNIKRNDFLQELININKESEALGEGEVYKFEQIAAHCITFLVNGYYPLATSIGFCLYELACNDDVQKKVRQEIKQAHSNVNHLDYEALQKLKYLDMVIAETLRIHPPIQTMTRQCTESTSLDLDGMKYPISKGTAVNIPIYALHRDENKFPQPESFKPERFVDPKMDKMNYLPFGAGPRLCPAKELSKIIMKMAIAAIISQFDVKPIEDDPVIKLDPHKIFHRTVKGGLWLKFENLNNSSVFYT